MTKERGESSVVDPEALTKRGGPAFEKTVDAGEVGGVLDSAKQQLGVATEEVAVSEQVALDPELETAISRVEEAGDVSLLQTLADDGKLGVKSESTEGKIYTVQKVRGIVGDGEEQCVDLYLGTEPGTTEESIIFIDKKVFLENLRKLLVLQ